MVFSVILLADFRGGKDTLLERVKNVMVGSCSFDKTSCRKVGLLSSTSRKESKKKLDPREKN